MAGKKAKSDLDGMRADIRTLSEAVWALRNQVSFEAATAAANGHGNGNGASQPNGTAATDLLAGEGPGSVISRGVIRTSDGASEISWDHEIAVADLLQGTTEEPAKVLAAIGQPQRLAIARVLLDGPSTAAALVTSLDLGTTGAAYHHLNVLQGAGLVAQSSRGVFDLVPERAGTILTILAALSTVSVPTVAEDQVDAEATGKKKRKKAG